MVMTLQVDKKHLPLEVPRDHKLVIRPDTPQNDVVPLVFTMGEKYEFQVDRDMLITMKGELIVIPPDEAQTSVWGYEDEEG